MSASSYRLGQPRPVVPHQSIPLELSQAYSRVNGRISQLVNGRIKAGIVVVSDDELRAELAAVQIQTSLGQFALAKRQVDGLAAKVGQWQDELDRRTAQAPPPVPPSGVIDIPILLYHYPPPDFERQLQILVERGYSVVDLDQVAAALAGQGSLPAKPAVITFDDGFADQMAAFGLLQKYQMKSTFYIMNGGEASAWCVGAGRRYDQPGGCGDAYLNWDQVRALDKSGLITIGGHTVDHLNLQGKSPEVQRFEIENSKQVIEQQLGHAIKHFAYPYGGYDGTTIELVRQVGYLTAVTTLPGTYQTGGQPFTLRRIRDTYALP